MKTETDMLLVPAPRRIEFTGGTLDIPVMPGVSPGASPHRGFEKIIRREIGHFTVARNGKPDVALQPAEASPPGLRKWALLDEGYALVVDAGGVTIHAATQAGFLYGIMTLRQLLCQFGNRVPCLGIGDAPVLKHRGVQLSFPQGHTAYRHSYMQHLVPELARWKINALYLYLESYFDFPSLPHTAGPGAMTAQEALELDELCRAYHIDLIPQLNLMAHSGELLALQKYSHLKEYVPGKDPRLAAGFNLCASSPEVRQLVDTMLEDVFACFSSDTVHVGGDEVSILGQCPICKKASKGKTPFEFYGDYFGRIRDIALGNGKRIGIWGDMLLHHGHALSADVQRKQFEPLKNGVVIYDWHYSGGAPETLKFFVDRGFETIACSSSHLCYSSALWPAQSENQRLLFADAVAAGAAGGMTTAWCNFAGLHEEQLNYLFATGGGILWSGAGTKSLVPGISTETFERAYALQRYGLKKDTLMQYLHLLGDGSGPLLQRLAPINGVNLRKCLYHTDNVLTFWRHYSDLLKGDGIRHYRRAISRGRNLWERLSKEASACRDPYLHLLEGPLLMHEHLVRRYEMTEQLYAVYDKAAKLQFRRQAEFVRLMGEAADILIGHLADFPPIEKYLADARRKLGLDRSSILRVRATKKNLRHLADYLRHLTCSDRPLPAFIQLDKLFPLTARTNWYGDREHEWAVEPPRFQHYTIEAGPWIVEVPNASREPGPHIAVTDFRVSPVKAFDGNLDKLECPSSRATQRFRKRSFSATQCSLHELFEDGSNQVVYYLCRLTCPEAMSLEIGVGYDGPVKVWLDSRFVFQDPAGTNPAVAEQARLPFSAKKGPHEIMIAMSSNCGRAFGIFLKITRKDVAQAVAGEWVLPEMDF